MPPTSVIAASMADRLAARSVTSNGWIEFKLFGQSSNRSAIDAVIKLTAGGKTQMRRVSGGDSAHSQSDLIVHFGTGLENLVERGRLQSVEDIRRVIAETGREPIERDTLYRRVVRDESNPSQWSVGEAVATA